MSLVPPRSTRCAPVASAVNMCVTETSLWKEQRHHSHLLLFRFVRGTTRDLGTARNRKDGLINLLPPRKRSVTRTHPNPSLR